VRARFPLWGRQATHVISSDRGHQGIVHDDAMRGEQIQNGLAGGVIQITLAIVGATEGDTHLDPAGALQLQFPTGGRAPVLVSAAAVDSASSGSPQPINRGRQGTQASLIAASTLPMRRACSSGGNFAISAMNP
jgi:hypothetical protein